MDVKIPVTKKDLFNNYLIFLNPILKLREESEIPVLAAFLTLHYTYGHLNKYKEDTLNSLLFSTETKDGIRQKLGFSEKSFNKSMKRLYEKEMLIGSSINPKLTIYPKDNKFKLNISFIEDNVK